MEIRLNSLAPRRLTASLLTLFALLALVIAATGIGGVLAFSVSQRTREFGVRLALGAQPGQVLSMVVRQGGAMVGLGLALGSIGAIWLARFMEGLVYGVGTVIPSPRRRVPNACGGRRDRQPRTAARVRRRSTRSSRSGTGRRRTYRTLSVISQFIRQASSV
jgi:hypothetical protein